MYKPATTANDISSPDTRFKDNASPELNSPGDISEVAWATRYPSPILEESDTSQKDVSSPDDLNSCSTPAARDTERAGSSRWVKLACEDRTATVTLKRKSGKYPVKYTNYRL